MRTAVRLYRAREVLEATGISRRTLRIYEEVGLISPSDLEDGAPLYAEGTIETLNRIQRLRDELGVNLAGVQIILEMRRKIESLQTDLEEVIRFVQQDLRRELEQYLRREEKAVIPKPLTRPPKPWEEE
jgi:MerR family transcriptional regulator/heat shock protein HspR